MENEIRRNNLKNFFITYVLCKCRRYRPRVCRYFSQMRMNVVAFIYISSRLRKNSHEHAFIWSRKYIFIRLFFVTRGFLRVSFLSRILDGKSMTHTQWPLIVSTTSRISYTLFTHLEIPRNWIFLKSLFTSRFVTKWTKCDTCHFSL